MESGGNQRPRPVPMEKRIYGVPVFPGPSTSFVASQNVTSPGTTPGSYYSPAPASGAVERNSRPISSIRPTSISEERLLSPQAVVEVSLSTDPGPASSATRRSVPTITGAAAVITPNSISPHVTVIPIAVPVAAAASPAPAPSQLRWNLHHVDFLPAAVKSKKDDEYDRFPALIERANQWSVQNPQFHVFSCETVTWTGIDRTIFTDAGVMMKSMSSDKKTKVLRGLRVWYFVYDDTFYDKSFSPGPFKLGCINYALEGKADTIVSLLGKVNSDMFKRTVAGKILKVETLMMLSDIGDCDVSAWTEQPDKSRDYVSFVRLYYVFKKDGMEDCKYGDIGIRDFVPTFDQRTPHNQGYEVFADLWSKAARWIYTNPQLKFINAQGVFVKVKKETENASLTLWDRCNHREHGSAYGSISHQKTEYFQILRVVYHQPPTGASPSNGSASSTQSEAGSGPKKLYYKSFSPSVLKRAVASGSEDQDQSPPADGLYEDLRQLEEKTNAWLAFSDAKVSNVETVPTRLVTGGQEMIGPEATFVYNDREKNQSKEVWRVNVRIYLDGEFHEPPATWRHSIVERKSIALTSGVSPHQLAD